MKRLEGILPPIPTPFDREGRVAHDRLSANLERWVAAGLHGFVVLGSNGEYVMLDAVEKFAVWETARAAIPPDRLFIAGTGAESTGAALMLVRRAAEFGADAALVVTPHYYKGQMGRASQVSHYRALADASPIPVLLYNVPANTGLDLDVDTIVELSGHPNIAGMKDSSGNLAKMGEVLQNVSPDFAVLVGTGSLIVPAFSLGARGAVPALGNVAAGKLIQLWRDFQAGNWSAARAAQLPLVELNRLLTAQFGVPALKAALDLLGYYGGPCRPPLLPLTREQSAKLLTTLTHAGLLSSVPQPESREPAMTAPVLGD